MIYYISTPLNRIQKDTDDVIQSIYNNVSSYIRARYWVKGSKSYNDDWIPDAKFVVFLLPGNSFEYKLGHLPVGVRKEFKRCKKLNKLTFIGYRNRDGEMNLYKYSYNKTADRIKGIPGTTGDVLKIISDLKSNKTEIKEIEQECWYDPIPSLDKRILLPPT